MKKVFLVFAIAVISLGSANAQDNAGPHFSGGVRVAMPIGDWSDFVSFGIGAELQGEYMFSEMFSALVQTGYTHLLAKEFMGIKGESTGLIPVLAGVRVYPSANFFIGAKAGLSFSTESGAGSTFTYEPQVGYNAEKFQVAAGYTGMSKNSMTNSMIGLSFLYKFN